MSLLEIELRSLTLFSIIISFYSLNYFLAIYFFVFNLNLGISLCIKLLSLSPFNIFDLIFTQTQRERERERERETYIILYHIILYLYACVHASVY